MSGMSTSPARPSIRALVLMVVLAVAVVVVPSPAVAQTATIPSVGANFGGTGPYGVATTAEGAHTFFHPENPGAGGVRHPVILWGNGTGASVSTYAGLLRHFASHGFVVAAANTTNAGSGVEMLAGLDTLAVWNTAAGHRFAGAVDLGRVGATGHSQGAYGAVRAGRDPRVDTVFPLQGGARAIDVDSALYLAGGGDTIVTPGLVRLGFSATTVPAAYAELAGATHFTPIFDGGGFRPVATAWARMELMDDANARTLFRSPTCGLCTAGSWTYETNAAFGAQPVDVPPFSDVAGDTHAAAIEVFAETGIGQGFADGSFRPGLPVTRAQAATFLLRALDLAEAPATRFPDVPAGSTHAGAIGAIAQAGITSGYADGTFRPGAAVSREQMASLLVAAFDLPTASGGGRFPDVGGVHAPAVAAIADAGIAAGYPDGTFRPGQPVTRGQMATLIVAALERAAA